MEKIKKIGFLITLIIAIVIDSFIGINTFYRNNISEEIFWIYHIVLALIFIFINYSFFKKDITYFDVLIILFPAIGYISLFTINILPKRDPHYTEIEENVELEYYIKDKQEVEYIDVALQLGLIGAYDNILTDTFREKKKFLMGFNPPNIGLKVSILKKALLDEEIDVIHYAAVELNKIDEEFQNNISIAEKDKDLEKLANIYIKYIDSGILEGELLKLYQEKALKTIKSLNSNEWTLSELKLLKALKLDKECDGKLTTLLKTLNDTRITDFAMMYYYEKNNFKKVIDIKENGPKNSAPLPLYLRNFYAKR